MADVVVKAIATGNIDEVRKVSIDNTIAHKQMHSDTLSNDTILQLVWDINQPLDAFERTAIHLAALHDNVALIKVLLKKGTH
jgi:ankyrin repeat protein